MSSPKKTSVKLFPIFNFKQWKTIKSLPAELLEMVFKKLPPEDLISVMLVCKRWEKAADNPDLWTGVSFERKQVNKILREALVSTRLKELVIRRVMLARDIDESLLYRTVGVVGLRSSEHTDGVEWNWIMTREEAEGGDGSEYYRDQDNGDGNDSDFGDDSEDDDDGGDGSDKSSNGEDEVDHSDDEEQENNDENHDNIGEQPSQPSYHQGRQNDSDSDMDSAMLYGSVASWIFDRGQEVVQRGLNVKAQNGFATGTYSDSGSGMLYDSAAACAAAQRLRASDRGQGVGGVHRGQKRDNNGGFRDLHPYPTYGNHSGGKRGWESAEDRVVGTWLKQSLAKKRKVTSQNVDSSCLRCNLCNVTSHNKTNHEQHMNGKRHRSQVAENTPRRNREIIRWR